MDHLTHPCARNTCTILLLTFLIVKHYPVFTASILTIYLKKTKIYCFICRIFGEHAPSMDKLTMKSNQNHICDQLKIKKTILTKK